MMQLSIVCVSLLLAFVLCDVTIVNTTPYDKIYMRSETSYIDRIRFRLVDGSNPAPFGTPYFYKAYPNDCMENTYDLESDLASYTPTGDNNIGFIPVIPLVEHECIIEVCLGTVASPTGVCSNLTSLSQTFAPTPSGSAYTVQVDSPSLIYKDPFNPGYYHDNLNFTVYKSNNLVPPAERVFYYTKYPDDCMDPSYFDTDTFLLNSDYNEVPLSGFTGIQSGGCQINITLGPRNTNNTLTFYIGTILPVDYDYGPLEYKYTVYTPYYNVLIDSVLPSDYQYYLRFNLKANGNPIRYSQVQLTSTPTGCTSTGFGGTYYLDGVGTVTIARPKSSTSIPPQGCNITATITFGSITLTSPVLMVLTNGLYKLPDYSHVTLNKKYKSPIYHLGSSEAYYQPIVFDFLQNGTLATQALNYYITSSPSTCSPDPRIGSVLDNSGGNNVSIVLSANSYIPNNCSLTLNMGTIAQPSGVTFSLGTLSSLVVPLPQGNYTIQIISNSVLYRDGVLPRYLFPLEFKVLKDGQALDAIMYFHYVFDKEGCTTSPISTRTFATLQDGTYSAYLTASSTPPSTGCNVKIVLGVYGVNGTESDSFLLSNQVASSHIQSIVVSIDNGRYLLERYTLAIFGVVSGITTLVILSRLFTKYPIRKR
jgi:hypothetical protein